MSILFELHKSGLIDYLWEKLAPQTIVLYGSYAKGEVTKKSDLDIAVIVESEQTKKEIIPFLEVS